MAFGVLVVATAAVALVREGMLWAAPLTTVVYGAVLVGAFVTAAALLLSVFLGTPGCDVGALEEAVQRLGHIRPQRRPQLLVHRRAPPARCMGGSQA
jgi:L-lactate permease